MSTLRGVTSTTASASADAEEEEEEEEEDKEDEEEDEEEEDEEDEDDIASHFKETQHLREFRRVIARFFRCLRVLA